MLINYSVGKKRLEKAPDAFDLALIEKIEQLDIPYWFPTDRMPEGYNTEQPKVSHGLTHVHHFYTKRNLWVIASFINKLSPLDQVSLRARLLFTKTAAERITSILASIAFSYFFHGGGGFINAGTKGTLYVSSTIPEVPAYVSLTSRLTSLNRQSVTVFKPAISTQSSGIVPLERYSVDYIFTDPPFGGNLMYSELSFLWEAWLKVFTNNIPEAVENKVQGKGLPEYQRLMTECFKEYYCTLKPGRWMTLEFHNSQNRVWNAIQEALQAAGFVIADVRTLDKKQGSFKQYTSAGTVKQDLVISAYKPNGGLEERFKLEAGTEEGVWDFVRTHLKQLPIFPLLFP